jgi:hypothetical protein
MDICFQNYCLFTYRVNRPSTVAGSVVLMNVRLRFLLVSCASGKPPVVVPAISETTKRSFHQATPGGSTQNMDVLPRAVPPSSAGYVHFVLYE